MELHKVRMWDGDQNRIFCMEYTIEQIIENPVRMYMIDVALILLNDARKQKGLEPFPKEFISGEAEWEKSFYERK